MKYVILGAGPAGVVAAETLRKADPSGQVILVGGEDAPPYSRMAIPYLLTGKITEDGTYLRKADEYYDRLGILYKRGRAAQVDPQKSTVVLEDGQSLDYDKLLVATGATPVTPPVPGLDLKGVHHCWTLEDARAIAALAQAGSNVVLMGAGFIGCIILESLVERGVNLTVVEAEDRMISRMMDETGGDMLKRWVEAQGVYLLTSTKVTSVSEIGGSLSVSTDKAGHLPADLVVVSVGVKPNTDFLKGSGVAIDVGIEVDDRLQTSVPNIYAAGDVAQGPDFGGGFHVHAVQPTSVEHGRIAALNMAGADAKYRGSLIMNVLDTMGLVSASFGHWMGEDDVAVMLDQDDHRYTKLAFHGDHLVGALMLGRTDQIGVLRGLIQTRVRLGAWKDKLKKDPSLIAQAYVACTQG
ncbi:NAD(P)/FAD-dependent oxidoreductase [Magnetovibrio blakemorei]|uniref:Pyridine nucleotide-disulfide oxidoreductase n=1 Tax=Magnetovibrio blakemorei TaxID=28181 RepID=A0A1E5Q7A8_9PROT|nr:FAD-dependent oxidoreductase [Magnetovibrio blakemorei]OEJ66997.1 pyridine nucleotide-disulfide oxidoreductase [Magnetovibrio blakemorei]